MIWPLKNQEKVESMKADHSSLIRGLNIAVTVLAALSLVSCVVGLAVLGSVKGYAYDALAEEYARTYDYDDYWDDYYYDYWDDWDDWDDDFGWDDDGYGYGHGHGHHSNASVHHAALTPAASGYYSYSGDIEDAYAAMDVTFGLVTVAVIWEIIISIACLLLGIFGIVSAGKPAKLKTVMVMGIVGAVVSFLGGHIILTALFIISAVMANKDKTALLNASMPAPAPAAAPVAAPGAAPYPGTTEQAPQDPTHPTP